MSDNDSKIIPLMTDAVDKAKTIEVKPEDTAYGFVGPKRRPMPNLKLYKMHADRMVAELVPLNKEISAVIGPDGKPLMNVTFRPEPMHLYTWAMNKANAQRKIINYLHDYVRRMGLNKVDQSSIIDPVQHGKEGKAETPQA